MQIKINKDFLTEYKDDAWKGFTAQEIFSIVTGAGVAFMVIILLYFFAGISPAAAVYIGVPVAAPVIFSGFYRYQGYLSPKQLFVEIRYTRKATGLFYDTGEGKEIRRIFCMHQNQKEVRRKRKGGAGHGCCRSK